MLKKLEDRHKFLEDRLKNFCDECEIKPCEYEYCELQVTRILDEIEEINNKIDSILNSNEAYNSIDK